MEESWFHGLGLGILDTIYIRLDGTTVTSAVIPFAEGLHLPDNKNATFGNTAESPDMKIYSDGTSGIIFGTLILHNDLTAPNEARLWFGTTKNSCIYREEDGDTWILGNMSNTLDISTWNAVAFLDITQLTVLCTARIGLMGYGGTCSIEFSSDGLFFKVSDTDKFVFNFQKYNADLQIRGTTDDNLLYTDASADRVGIGTNAPSELFDVNGISKANNFISDVAIGTSPYACTSTTLNTNLNADLLDSKHETAFLLVDGSRPLTANWDAGNFKITMGSFEAGGGLITSNNKILFRDSDIFIYSNADGEVTLQADVKTIIGVAGDIELGDGTERDMFPNTDLKINLGKSSYRFNNIYANVATLASTLTASNFISTVAIGTQPYACTSTTLNTNLNADLLDSKHETAFLLVDGSRELSADWDAGSHKIIAEQFESDVATTTPPFIVASTTLVTNLNADLLDSKHETAFLLVDGSRELSADWDAGSHKIIAEQLESDVTTTTAPLIIASTTLVSNLNADMLDGKHIGTSGNTVPLLDGVNTWSANQKLNDDIKLILGTGSDVEIYSSSDDLYIKNVTQDKDIIFNINDGGVAKDFMKIDSSSPTLELAAGTFAGAIGTPILYIHGNAVVTAVGIVMRFVVTNNGAGTAYITYGEPKIGQATGGQLIGHHLLPRGVHGTSGTHLKVGYDVDIDMPTLAGTMGGNFTDRGFEAIMGGMMIFPDNVSGSDIIHEGMKISRIAYNVSNALGGSINNLTSYGLHITGWGSADTVTGVAGTFTNYAIYSDGGNTYFGTGDHSFVGDVDITGGLVVGDGGTTNYAEFKNDGEINLHGTARVKRHIDIGAASWKKGATAPTDGLSGNFPHLSFADNADEAAHYELIVPFRRATGTDIDIIVDWYYTGAQDNGKVLWKMTYLSVKSGEDPTAAGTTVSQLTAGTHTTGQLVRTTFSTGMIDANLENHDTLGLKFWRDGDDGTDTLAKAAIMLDVHIEFILDKLGEAT